MTENQGTETVKVIYHALQDKKAGDIRIIRLSNKVSIVADYFVIASGSNRNQVHALADNVEEELHKIGHHPRHIEGYQTAHWILMDYGDFIIHIFDEENRSFYDLERLWRDGAAIEIPDFEE